MYIYTQTELYTVQLYSSLERFLETDEVTAKVTLDYKKHRKILLISPSV